MPQDLVLQIYLKYWQLNQHLEGSKLCIKLLTTISERTGFGMLDYSMHRA